MADEDKPKANGNGKEPDDKEKEPAGRGKAPVDVLDRVATRKGSVQAVPLGAAIPLTVMFAAAADGAPQWWSPGRDIYLDKFWKGEGLLSGTIYSMAARNASYNFQLTGPPEATKKSQQMLMGAEFGAGWQTFILKVSQDLLGQDNGTFMEVVRPARANFKWLGERHTALAQKSLVNGELQWCAVGRGNVLLPLAGLDYDIKDSPGDQAIGVAHLDAQACSRTGDDEYPVIYVDRLGVPHKLAWYQVLTMEDLPTARQSMNGVSFCAVSRVLRAAQILREIRQYQYEKVSGRFNRAVHMVNVDADVIQQQMQMAEAEADNRGLLRYMHPIIISTLDPQATPTVATINLAGLPDNFDTEKFLTWYITEIALGTGVDYGFLAPLPGTGLGSASQSETMARQSRGKSARLFMNMLAAKLNFGGVLPKSVEMEFHEIDYEEEAAKAGVASTRASTRASRITSGEITPTVARQIAEDEGDLKHDYLELLAEEDATREEIIQSWQQPGAQIVGDPAIMGKLGAQVKKEQEAAAAGKPGSGGGMPGAAPAGPAGAAATPLVPSARQQLIRQAAAKLGAATAAAPTPGVTDHAAVGSTEKPTAGKPAPKAKPVKATLSAGKKERIPNGSGISSAAIEAFAQGYKHGGGPTHHGDHASGSPQSVHAGGRVRPKSTTPRMPVAPVPKMSQAALSEEELADIQDIYIVWKNKPLEERRAAWNELTEDEKLALTDAGLGAEKFLRPDKKIGASQRGEKPVGEKPSIAGLPEIPANIGESEVVMSGKAEKSIEKIFGVTREDMLRMYAVDDPEISSTISVKFSSRDGARIDCEYSDKTGKIIGKSKRLYSKDDWGAICDNEILEFEAGYEGKGLANSLYARQLATLRERGFAQVTLTANITIGRYAWARLGFDYMQKDSAQYHAKDFATWADYRGLKKPKGGWPKFKSAKEIADYDPGIVLHGSDIFCENVKPDMELHLGKAFMLDHGGDGHGEWRGVLRLKKV